MNKLIRLVLEEDVTLEESNEKFEVKSNNKNLEYLLKEILYRE